MTSEIADRFPGGVSNFFRHIPVIWEVCRDVPQTKDNHFYLRRSVYFGFSDRRSQRQTLIPQMAKQCCHKSQLSCYVLQRGDEWTIYLAFPHLNRSLEFRDTH